MAILWTGSLIPWLDESGDPYSGAKAYFFDAETTTPQVTYTDSALSIPHDHPVVANASGRFPAVFLVQGGSYRLRLTTASNVTISDTDGISVPTADLPDFPSGETEAQYLWQTGDIKIAWRSSAPNGFVRLNGRSIGSGASAATERANNDCEDLFIHLWEQDANLAVSGGRGGSAEGDWAAAKTIALPDWRGRSPVGMDSMGSSASNRITDAQLGADSDTLGSAGGSAAHTLTSGQIPSHLHSVSLSGNTGTAGAHTHQFRQAGSSGGSTTARDGGSGSFQGEMSTAGDHTHSVSLSGNTGNTGSGEAHNNLQPSIVVPFFIKL